MKPEFLNLYRKLRDCYGTLLLQMQELQQHINPDAGLNEQGDRVYALRECEKTADDLLKEIRKLYDLQQKTACLAELTSLQDGSATEWHSGGKAEEQKILVIPQKRRYDPPAFDTLMVDIGVPLSVSQSELVRPNWPELQRYYHDRLGEGRNIPIEIKDGFIYKYSVRKRKSLDAD